MSPNPDRYSAATLPRNGASVFEDPTVPRQIHRQPAPKHTPPPQPKARLGRLLFFVVLALGGAFAFGLMPKLRQQAIVVAETRELAMPTVILVTPTPAKAPPPLLLNGELKPVIDSPIYARATGYVKKWYVDIGAHVEVGQLMAELDIPDLDQQLTQARADLKHSEAARDLAATTAKRWEQLLSGKTVSKQEADEKAAEVPLTVSAVDSARANMQRIEQLVSFAKITAPFAGTVTARSLDVGQLVNAGSNQELFRVALTDKLRVFVRVPQNYARSVAEGQNAEIILPDQPGKKYPAKVVRTAGSMDAASRTLLTELEVDNAKGELLAGSYAQVRLSDSSADASLTVPSNTLLFRPDGPVVAAVLDGHHITLKHVKLGRDFGASVETLDGVEAHDRIVINPPDSMVDGVEVRINELAPGS